VRRELAARDRIRGEITLLVQAPAERTDPAGSSETIVSRMARMQSEAGIDEKEAMKRVARELGRSKSEIYRELQRERARPRSR
jgi:16S rRNA (cytidine1402-2'-O)-methyltransferase